MRYANIIPGVFLSRPNRFIAKVLVEGVEETVHVKNTGRCRELLVPGCQVWLERSVNPARKTLYDLVTVEKPLEGGGTKIVNMDSQAPNRLFAEWAAAGQFRPGLTLLRPETAWGHSRFDFYWEAAEKKGFVEVKGCTLEEDGLALFPDAPTQRGVKHLRELAACREAGYEAAVCVVVQMAGMTAFSPTDRTHPQCGSALREAARAGVRVLAVECAAAPDSLTITGPVPVRL